jgi:hypothetical protein
MSEDNDMMRSCLSSSFVGLSDLSSYRATLTISFAGAATGQPLEWTRAYTLLVSQNLPARQLTIDASDDPDGQGANSVAFKPDGTLLASGGPLGGVVLWGTSAEGEAAQGSSTAETSATTTTEETTTSTAGSTFTAPDNANLRSGPGASFDRAGALSEGQTVEVDGQTQGTDGVAWYRLVSGAWVRSDVVGAPAACANVPVVAG